MMVKFSELGIQYEKKGFVGDKLKIDRILNRPIVVHKYEIKDSIKKDNSKCLYLQINVNGSDHVLFTGSKSLIEMIQKVPNASFPFETTIVKDDNILKFT